MKNENSTPLQPMVLKINENIKIWKKYNPIELSMYQSGHLATPESYFLQSLTEIPTRIFILDEWYNVIPSYELRRTKSNDGYFRFIYIQIDIATGEYYIGKVNRKRWRELLNYPGSGLKFKAKYSKHPENYVRYYIAACNSAEETEILEATIVNEELLKDPFCLNLVKGGGGTNAHNNDKEKREKQREYMKAHPEQYEAMKKAQRALYQSGNTMALRERTTKIKKTMSDEKYRSMTKERIAKWKENNPEEYKKAREKNTASIRTEKTRKKKSESFHRFRENNPETYNQILKKRVSAAHSPEAEKKRSQSLKEYYRNHPEATKKRTNASIEAKIKPVKMLNLETGEIVKRFSSQLEAAEWLVENGYAKNTNCRASISAVCLKKPCTTGYGYRKKAYGFGWEFDTKE